MPPKVEFVTHCAVSVAQEPTPAGPGRNRDIHNNSAGPARDGFLRVPDAGAAFTELLFQIISDARWCGRNPGRKFGRALLPTGSTRQRKTGRASQPGRVVRRPETNRLFVAGSTQCHTLVLWLAGKRRMRRDRRSMPLE